MAKHDYKLQHDLEMQALLGGAYEQERRRRVKAAQDPTTDDSPVYQEEKRSVRYQGVFSPSTHDTAARKVSVSVHKRMRDAAQRVRNREKK